MSMFFVGVGFNGSRHADIVPLAGRALWVNGRSVPSEGPQCQSAVSAVLHYGVVHARSTKYEPNYAIRILRSGPDRRRTAQGRHENAAPGAALSSPRTTARARRRGRDS